MIYKYKYIIYTEVLECICPVKHLNFFFFLNPQIILLHGGCESRCTILFTGRTRGGIQYRVTVEKKKVGCVAVVSCLPLRCRPPRSGVLKSIV